MIIADPPWQFADSNTRGAAERHYPTMLTRHMYRIPVEEWSADNAAMFMWTTDSHMEEALGLMKVWGFKMKQIIPWIKRSEAGKVQIGMGHYFRHVSELCIFGTRGKMKMARRDLPAVVFAPRGKHSAKPEAIHRLAEMAFPGHSCLEMFARARRKGWAVFGNEISG